MPNNFIRICGLTKKEILGRIGKVNSKIEVKVVETALDAKITVGSSIITGEELDRECSKIFRLFSDEIYSATDEPLQAVAAKLLKLNRKTVAVAESLTGGLICSMLAEVPGISANLYEGIVCYNVKSKMKRLGVRRDTLAEYGAVSRQTAVEMVRGLLCDRVDIALSTTGLAGPDGDEGKPVGLVYIAVGSSDYVTAFERRLCGDRNTVRRSTANLALFYLIRYLRGDILTL